MNQTLTKSQSHAWAMMNDGARFTHNTHLPGRGSGCFENGKTTPSVPSKKTLDELVALGWAEVEVAGGKSVYTAKGAK